MSKQQHATSEQTEPIEVDLGVRGLDGELDSDHPRCYAAGGIHIYHWPYVPRKGRQRNGTETELRITTSRESLANGYTGQQLDAINQYLADLAVRLTTDLGQYLSELTGRPLEIQDAAYWEQWWIDNPEGE
jgi:hypothetical protein